MAGTLVPPLPGSTEAEPLYVPEESRRILIERGYPTDPESLWGLRHFIHRPDLLAEIIPTREQIEAGRRDIESNPEFAESLRMLGRLDDEEKSRRAAAMARRSRS